MAQCSTRQTCSTGSPEMRSFLRSWWAYSARITRSNCRRSANSLRRVTRKKWNALRTASRERWPTWLLFGLAEWRQNSNIWAAAEICKGRLKKALHWKERSPAPNKPWRSFAERLSDEGLDCRGRPDFARAPLPAARQVGL